MARRVLAPQPGLAPAVRRHHHRLPRGPARLFLCAVISLLPGTAVIEIAPDHALVHVLSDSPRVDRELRVLEERVAALFDLTLAPGDASTEER